MQPKKDPVLHLLGMREIYLATAELPHPDLDNADGASIARLHAVFARQCQSFAADGIPSLAVRRDRIDRAIGMLVDHRQALCEALSEDFSNRSHEQSAMLDIAATLEQLKHVRKHMARWMRPQRRRPNLPLGPLGAKAEIRFEPKGVMANIAPWNFPVHLAIAPLAPMLAAGNRVIIKLSELTPRTADLLQTLIAETFAETEVAAFSGGPDFGAAFAALPFDHILFTGSPRVGKLVMREAAANLCPVTLELGGKSPVVVTDGADLAYAAQRVAWGKLLNAGQICLAPDHVFVPEAQLEEFISAYTDATATMYPALLDNPDYTAMISGHHLERMHGYIAEARAAGARVIEINPSGEDFSQQNARKMAPTLIVDPPEHLGLMRDEIFGPLLPIRTYAGLDTVIAKINANPHPLALYVFGQPAAVEKVLANTHSGGAAINDVIMHVMQEDLPFGGIGNSGMGAYHGEFGFRTFSHMRSVYRGTRLDPMQLLKPPYGKLARRILDFMIKR